MQIFTLIRRRSSSQLFFLFMLLLFIWTCIEGKAQNPPSGPIKQASHVVPGELPRVRPRDGTNLPASAQPIFYSAHRAMDWLKLANKPDGRFVYGFLPALRVPMEGDHFLSQAGATLALARAARYFQDERGTAVARQAALALLMETAVDTKDPSLRFTAAPPQALPRLASHGLIILAVHEMAAPGKDLLDQADQLANYLRKLQRADGALMDCENGESKKLPATEQEIQHAGIALHALLRSHKQRPAAWKIDMVRKAHAYYQSSWSENKNVAMVVSHTPAYAEAYLLTGDKGFAESVFAMNDWLIGLQYREDHVSANKHWLGGFQNCVGGKAERVVPDISSALAAESLAEACRVARHAGDLHHLQRYERALLLDLHFLMSLQYTNAKVQHFIENFRPAILGAFHASHQDGNLRLDYTQHPLCAMVQYLDAVID